MDNCDKSRIENAIWILEQYREDIINMAEDMKLDDYEIEAMFTTLSYVRGTVMKTLEGR